MGAGRPRIFETPEDLWKAWAAFKEDVKAQGEQWKRVQYVGKDGLKKEDPAKVPLTLEGFKRFCRNNYGEVQHYFDNTDKAYEEFCVICRAIREEIREDQIIGGMLSFYNPSITQRLNGLVEKQETSITIEQPLFGE